MKQISRADLLARFASIVEPKEAERRLNAAALRLGVMPQGPFSLEDLTRISGLILSDGLEETASGLLGAAPQLRQMMENA